MAKIGSYSYPTLSPAKAIEIIEILEKVFDGKPSNKDAFAQKIGHTNTNSGAYVQKMIDMRRYGLLDRGLVTSALAKKIVYPNSAEEREDALSEMILKVTLFNKLSEKLGDEAPDKDFHIILQEVLKIDRKEATEKALEISKVYMRVLPYIRKQRAGEVDDEEEIDQEDQSTPGKPPKTGKIPKVPENMILLKSGEMNIQVPLNDTNIDTLIKFLKTMKKETGTSETEGTQ